VNSQRPSHAVPSEFADSPLAIRTYRECAAIMHIHWTAAQQAEQRALKKLADHPLMRRLLEEITR
jgi:hypothetical protein